MRTVTGAALGIDIGGTFTDVVLHERARGASHSIKVLTTHDDPSRGALAGVRALLGTAGIDAASIARVVHATTLFTNALIERTGAKTGLLTTAGFRDVLEIGRERKFDLYDIRTAKPEPLAPRDLRREVDERVDRDGRERRPLDEAGLVREAEALVADGVASLAIVFLHAYANGAHEQAAAAALAARFPEMPVTTSHEVAPEIREYERASTTVANAYIKPLAAHYLDAMARELAALGVVAPLHLMVSSGGLTHLAEAKRVPVRLLESGPAAGAIAAAFFGAADAGGNLLAFDMGGTTAKLSLIEAGEPLVAYSFEAARSKRFVEGSGLPIRISTIELIEIGAGGGSIAALDEIGLLKVGPRSAGSEPGPACYGRGGSEPTVTDADLALGYLNPAFFAGGTLQIDAAAGEAALGRLARELAIEPIELAWGIHDIVNENMAGAARVHIAERGRDPRDFTLLATGGGGPVHADQVARKLGLARLICPPSAGVASALGLLVAPARVDRIATLGFALADGDLAALEAAFARIEAEARAVIAETGLAASSARVHRLADGRFVGQAFDLVVPLPDGPYDSAAAAATVRAALQEAFEAAYRAKYSRTPPAVPIEFINIRVDVRAAVPGATARPGAPGARDGAAIKGLRRAWFPGGGFVETAVYDRDRLSPGDAFDGPAVVEESGSTLVIGPGACAEVLANRNIVVSLPDPGGER